MLRGIALNDTPRHSLLRNKGLEPLLPRISRMNTDFFDAFREIRVIRDYSIPFEFFIVSAGGTKKPHSSLVGFTFVLNFSLG